jgi:hypothetical protein
VAGHAREGSLKEEEVLQQEKVEGQRRKGWTNIAGAALSGRARGRRGQGCTRCREGATSNGENVKAEGRRTTRNTDYSTCNTRNAVAHRFLACFISCLLAGMGWDGLASTIVLWGVFESRSQTQVPSPVAAPALLRAAIIHRASCEGDIRFACRLTGIKIHHHY